MATGNYIIRSDDGKLYRVSTQQLFANPLPPDDPAAQYGSDLETLANTVKASGEKTTPYGCVIALVEPGQSGSPGRKD
jgi:hypothetical protein